MLDSYAEGPGFKSMRCQKFWSVFSLVFGLVSGVRSLLLLGGMVRDFSDHAFKSVSPPNGRLAPCGCRERGNTGAFGPLGLPAPPARNSWP